jgi:hypothetical protein
MTRKTTRRKYTHASSAVEKAVGRYNIHHLLLEAKIRVYVLDDGVDDSEYLSGVMLSLQVVGMAAERQWPQGMPTDVARDYNVLRGGLSALYQVFTRWDRQQAGAVEQGIVRAEQLHKLLRNEHVLSATIEALAMQRGALSAAAA